MSGVETATLIDNLLPYAVGPVSGLVISLVFAFFLRIDGQKNRDSYEKAVEKQVAVMGQVADAHKAMAEAHKVELDHCHKNYQALHDKVFGLMFDHFSVKKQVEKLEEINVKRKDRE